MEDPSDEDEDYIGPSLKKVRDTTGERKSRRLEIEKMKLESGEYYEEEEEENVVF